MVIADGAMFLIVLLQLTYVLLAVFLLIPRALRSSFRYRLWQIRDAVVNDRFTGELPRCGLVDAFVGRIEDLIQDSHQVTMLHWVFGPKTPKRNGDISR